MSQSESRIQIFVLFDWMTQFSLLQPDVARTCSRTAVIGWSGNGTLFSGKVTSAGQHRVVGKVTLSHACGIVDCGNLRPYYCQQAQGFRQEWRKAPVRVLVLVAPYFMFV